MKLLYTTPNWMDGFFNCRDGFPMVSALVYVMHTKQNLQ